MYSLKTPSLDAQDLHQFCVGWVTGQSVAPPTGTYTDQARRDRSRWKSDADPQPSQPDRANVQSARRGLRVRWARRLLRRPPEADVGGEVAVSLPSSFAPRLLHPGAWWIWALGLTTAAARTTNPLLLVLIAAVAGLVVSERHVPGPWSHSYAAFLKFGLAVITIRVVLEILVGGSDLGVPVVTLPEIPLPSWMAGVNLGGLVTLDGVLGAVFDGLRLAVMLACIGAANSLVNPSRLLRLVPAALYEAGVAVVVCMTLAPVLVADLGRIQHARRLRGRGSSGPRAWGQMALPLFSGALDRSVALAASMDARGYGRAGDQPAAARRWNSVLVLGGLLGLLVGLYGLMTGGSPGMIGASSAWAWPTVVIGAALAVGGSLLAGRRVTRTRYRPDRWLLPETLVAVCGVVPAVVMIAAGNDPALVGPSSPPGLPALPLLPAAAILVAALPAFLSPLPPHSVRPESRAELVGAE